MNIPKKKKKNKYSESMNQSNPFGEKLHERAEQELISAQPKKKEGKK